LEKEEARWLEIKQQIDAEKEEENDVDSSSINVVDKEEESSSEIEICRSELRVAQEIEQLQQKALKDIGLYANKLALLQDSMQTIDQLILKTEVKKSELVDSYQQTIFQGYKHFTNAKDALRSFTKLF
jgi:hypothetical protein